MKLQLDCQHKIVESRAAVVLPALMKKAGVPLATLRMPENLALSAADSGGHVPALGAVMLRDWNS